jgi:bifunctional DNA-binding transcriptional regulator/antitoxin component of YhaV-PrlF toxin-antitoxin module
MLSQPHHPIAGTYISTVNLKGRLTLPLPVRKMLRIEPDDKLLFRVEEGVVSIAGKLPTLEELAGSVTPLQPEKALQTVIREAKADHYHQRFLKPSPP